MIGKPFAPAAPSPAGVAPIPDFIVADGRPFDREIAVLVRDGVVRVVEDANPGLHPAVDVAGHGNLLPVGLEVFDQVLAAAGNDYVSAWVFSRAAGPVDVMGDRGRVVDNQRLPFAIARACGSNAQVGWSSSTCGLAGLA